MKRRHSLVVPLTALALLPLTACDDPDKPVTGIVEELEYQKQA